MATTPETVKLLVELPSYAYSFHVDAPLHGSVQDVKRLVQGLCTGNPSIQGQRIIWRGRALGDEERIQDLWKASLLSFCVFAWLLMLPLNQPSDSPHVVLLAVHPSAWTSTPPIIPATTAPAQPLGATATPSSFSTPAPLSSSSNLNFMSSQQPQHPMSSARRTPARMPQGPSPQVIETIPYVIYQHKNALITLVGGIRVPPDPQVSNAGRAKSIETLKEWGYIWPTILDEDYPAGGAANDPPLYEITEIRDRSYFRLLQPHPKPTPSQIHALKVLTYTFPIVVHSASRTTVATPVSMPLRHENGAPIRIPLNHEQVHLPPNINELLQQLGLPRVQLQHEPNARPVNQPNAAVRNAVAAEPHIRRLLVPLSMLLLRTALLLYFVAPIRKPVFAALVLMWVLYEAGQAVRTWFGQIGRARAPAQVQVPNPGAAVPAQPANGAANGPAPAPGLQQPVPRAPGAGPRAPLTFEQQVSFIFGALSNVNLQTEDYFLTTSDDRQVVRRISFLTKFTTFIILFFVTLHPAAWNKRRAALRQREGRIRTEAAIRRSEERDVTEPGDGEGEGEASEQTRAHVVENRAFNERRRKLVEAHARKPEWMKEYITRVVAGDWVDEAD
ncbi:hypothetical protein ONZ45_g16172 [Pleurotus djamor]|nr:hypothetical protein ONZ45_g16172 [Pleurotus djamor]